MRKLFMKEAGLVSVRVVALAFLAICVNSGVAQAASVKDAPKDTSGADCTISSAQTGAGTTMIVVANRLPVAKGYEKEFEKRFEHRIGAVDQMPGFIRIEILRPLLGDHYIILTYWESRAAFEAWMKSEAFKRAHAHANPASKEMFAGRNVCEVHEVIQMSEKTR